MAGCKPYIVFIIFLISVFGCSFAQTKAEQLDKYFTKRFSDFEYANVLVAENGNIIYQKSFGYSNDSTKTPLNDSSIFCLASVSKQFTAVGIIILKEKGKLSLSDDITKYLPELPYIGVTIRHLLNHTSGIPEWELLVEKTWDHSKIATNDDEVKWFAANKPPLLFPTGSKFKYTNTAYELLASIIERVSGKKYTDFQQENIFTPLSMSNTFVYSRRLAPKKIENFAWNYGYDSKAKKRVRLDYYKQYDQLYWMDGVVGANAIHSTTSDMLKWDQALYSDRLISKASQEEMFAPGKLNDGKAIEYGLGFFIAGKGNNLSEIYGKRVYHGGSWGGYGAWVERNISQNKTIIMLQNFTNDNHTYIGPAAKVLYDKTK